MQISLKNSMRRWIGNELLIVILFLCSGIPYLSYANTDMSEQPEKTIDPIFQTGYVNQSVHFDLVDTKVLLPHCRKSLSYFKALPTKVALYAKYENDATRIYIVGKKDNVRIFVLRDDVCEGGVPLFTLMKKYHTPKQIGDSPALTDREVSALFEDTLMRHAKAFGGKQQFLEWLDKEVEKVRDGCIAHGRPAGWCGFTYYDFPDAIKRVLEDFRTQQTKCTGVEAQTQKGAGSNSKSKGLGSN